MLLIIFGDWFVKMDFFRKTVVFVPLGKIKDRLFAKKVV